jgi:phosphoribosyl 1,2-cyclic phosphate phosphodiesterase
MRKPSGALPLLQNNRHPDRLKSQILRVTFLGTGTSSGVPMIGCDCEVCLSTDPMDKRLRSSVMVESGTIRMVIDTGPDFRYQMLRAGIRDLDAILFTHPHKDHIAGLDDVRAFNFFSGRAMPLYANELTEEALRREYHYAFADRRYPGVPELDIHRIDTAPFEVEGLRVTPIPVWHLKMPVLGFRIGDFTYITDANRIEPHVLDLIRGSRLLVLNALRNTPHISHFTLSEAISLVQQLEIPEARFTHISHQLGTHASVNPSLPKGIELAYDGLVIDL